MKKYFLLVTLGLLVASCVQKATDKTVFVTLTVTGKKNIQSVGIRGDGNPLSWEQDYPMKEVIKDSVYEACLHSRTAFAYSEMKCTVDGQWELENQPNRKIIYEDGKDTIFVRVNFDQP
ncbi:MULTISPECIES: hypothetical protein [unclassified Flavobacterium]|uniref:hypothetical protein n=1 Tax=unclassified Flavobacterium TaxID=196869 RepID=UPI001F139EB8|nr:MULTISPECIES: hypothetical protein [unclassified Flavobacterium]UMY64885.1 hypothetical protein MKO97_10210 [Flavobacterium sp. HJ-32-4]